MEQSSSPSSWDASRGAIICKTGLRTAFRWGVSAILFLCLGFYLLFPACGSFLKLMGERNAPCELTAAMASNPYYVSALGELKGVARFTPMTRLDGTLEAGDKSVNCEIKAVRADYLDVTLLEGALFPENATMPFLLINEAAAGRQQETSWGEEPLKLNFDDTVTVHADGRQVKGKICGIFADGSETPMAYMSYETAGRAFPRSESGEVLLALRNKGASEQVVSTLNRWGFYTNLDPMQAAQWELLGQQAIQGALSGLGFVICALALARSRRKQNRETEESEAAVLMLGGMTEGDMKKLRRVRILIPDLSCTALAVTVSLIAGTFSPLALILCLLFTAAHCQATR